MAQPPIDKLRLGPNLTAAIWRNDSEQSQPFFTVTFTRSYADAEGSWHDSQAFGRGDLLNLAKLADRAHSRVEQLIQYERQRETTSQSEAGDTGDTTAGKAQARARQRGA